MPTPDTSSPQLCYHCGQARQAGDLDLTHPKITTPHWFCCQGCKTISHTIIEGGWSDFYQYYQRPGKNPENPNEEWQDGEALDWQGFITHDQKECVVQLQAEQIHCAACVWLIERALAQENLAAITVQLAQKRIVLRWPTTDPSQNDAATTSTALLSRCLTRLRAIGYTATPILYYASRDQDARARRHLLLRMCIALFSAMQVMMVVWPSYFFTEIDPASSTLLRFASLIMTLPVITYAAWPLFKGALLSLRARAINMDVTIVFGLSTAFLASLWNQFVSNGPLYYDSITMFVALLLTSRYIEAAVQKSAAHHIDALARTLPQRADIAPHYPDTTQIRTVPSFTVKEQMVLRVRAGEVFAVDGRVLAGDSLVEEAVLSGESLPVAKTTGSPIYAGSKNIAEVLWVKASSSGQSSRVGQIVQQVQAALAYQPARLRVVDQVARYYLLMVCVVAIGAALIWWALGYGGQFSLQIMIAALVISCPCALSMAVPAARAAAIARLSKQGLLTLRGHTLDALARITDIVFDKTGTLTEGQFTLVEQNLFSPRDDQATCAHYVHALEAHTSHPLGLALKKALPLPDSAPLTLTHIHNQIAAGVMARHGERQLRIGTWAFVSQEWKESLRHQVEALMPPNAVEQADTMIYLGDQNGLLARYRFSDLARAQVTELLATLKASGYRLHLLSGDQIPTVKWWAQHWGMQGQGGLTPTDKAAFVRQLQSEGRCVLAIGDGINDAPLLAEADASITLANGSPLAQSAAAMIGLSNDVRVIARAIRVAQKMRTITQQNLIWALCYNALALPLAALGWVTPLIASIGMSLSSFLVVINAARLQWGRGAGK